MKWSLRIGRIAGIDVFVHWTFAILIVWLIGIHVAQGQALGVALRGVVFVLTIFGCVVLHELGHALTARRFGIKTRDITLLPIGGVARLERMPEDPKQELLVALAGPAVNVVIAAGLFLALVATAAVTTPDESLSVGGDFFSKLMYVNVALVVFNLLPAFPMDGGRVLRAILAQRMDYVQATQTAASVGQAMAVFFGLLGLFFNWFLIFIALFVYIGAQQESRIVQMRSLMQGIPVRMAMVTRLKAVTRDTPLAEIVADLLAGEQQDFPVVDGPAVVGVLTRGDVVAAIARGHQDDQAGTVMRTDCAVVDEREMLQDTFQRMQESDCPTLPVVRDGRLVGIITLENIGEWMMIQSAIRQSKTGPDTHDG
jgi:Zn-dependent protease